MYFTKSHGNVGKCQRKWIKSVFTIGCIFASPHVFSSIKLLLYVNLVILKLVVQACCDATEHKQEFHMSSRNSKGISQCQSGHCDLVFWYSIFVLGYFVVNSSCISKQRNHGGVWSGSGCSFFHFSFLSYILHSEITIHDRGKTNLRTLIC